MRDDLDAPLLDIETDSIPARASRLTGRIPAVFSADSEGLAMTKNRRCFISRLKAFTACGFMKISAHPAQEYPPPSPISKRCSVIRRWRLWQWMHKGALYTLPERSGGAQKPFPLYRFWQGQWDIVGEIPS